MYVHVVMYRHGGRLPLVFFAPLVFQGGTAAAAAADRDDNRAGIGMTIVTHMPPASTDSTPDLPGSMVGSQCDNSRFTCTHTAGAAWIGMRVVAKLGMRGSPAGFNASFVDGTPVSWSLPWSKIGIDPNNYSDRDGSCVAFGDYRWTNDGSGMLEPFSWGDVGCEDLLFPLCKKLAGGSQLMLCCH